MTVGLAIEMICWKCKEKVDGAVCVSCSTIQPPPPRPDYFGILGLPRRFFLTDLEQAYRKKSRRVHPDRFVGKSAVERRMSLLWTAALNEALRVLSKPISRARYLATGKGEVDESKKITLSPEFLESVFSLQLQAMEDPEAAANKARVDHDKLYQTLEDIFTRWEKEQDDSVLQMVEVLLAQLNYLQKLLPNNR